MKLFILLPLILALFFFVPQQSYEHQSGCHRWHSCPSDSGSYVCGDLGYYSQCPSYSKPVPKEETPKYVQPPIPSWIKNNAGWWSEGAIDNDAFVQGIQYLIKEDVLKIPPTSQGTSSGSNNIPSWIKNNAEWWAAGQIDDDSFIQGIQFLIKDGIVNISVKDK